MSKGNPVLIERNDHEGIECLNITLAAFNEELDLESPLLHARKPVKH